MAWRIDRDYITPSDEDTYAVGRGQGKLTGPTFTFRLRDDDGEIYYHGIADKLAVEEDSEDGGLYIALKWGEYFAGCTDLQVRARDGWSRGLVHKDFHPNPDEWVSIYG